VTIDGVNYRLTKHGRRRYLERAGPAADSEILTRCVGDPRAVWSPDPSDGFRLVTYLASPPPPPGTEGRARG
jgi:hypothetical protein